MPDESYTKKKVDQLNDEKAVHDQKFAGNSAHLGCSANFDRAIKNLELAIGQTDAEKCVEAKGKVEPPRADEPADYTEAGDIGDEQMPAGEIKTDKKPWNYDASKNIGADIPRKLKEFMAGL